MIDFIYCFNKFIPFNRAYGTQVVDDAAEGIVMRHLLDDAVLLHHHVGSGDSDPLFAL